MSGSKYKGGLHHLWWSRMSRLAPREVADRGHETPAQKSSYAASAFRSRLAPSLCSRFCAYISFFYLSTIINRTLQSNPPHRAGFQTRPQISLASNSFVVQGLGQLRGDRRSASSEVSPTTRGPSNPEHLFISPFFKSGVALQFCFTSLCQSKTTESDYPTGNRSESTNGVLTRPTPAARFSTNIANEFWSTLLCTGSTPSE
jgi:hypothetical protein